MNERFETFTILINRISRNIKKIKNNEMAKYNLKSSHISCLYYLYSLHSMTASELCEYCEEDKAIISRAVDYLENNGYLTCQSKSAKRYKCPLVLTDKGIEIGRHISDKISEVLSEINDAMTEEERIEFYRKLSAISSSLDKIASK